MSAAVTYDVSVRVAGLPEVKALEQYTTKYTEALRKANTEARKVGQISGQTRAGLSSAGQQIQDIAVQLEGGIAPARIMAQQLPQLLSGFGLLGVAAGTAAGVLIPLVSTMLDLRTAQEKLKAATDTLSAAQDQSKRSLSDLSDEYGRHAQLIKEVNDLRTSLAQSAVEKQLKADAEAWLTNDKAVQSVFEGLSQLQSAVANYEFGRTAIGRLIAPLSEAAERIALVRDRLGLTQEAAEAATPIIDKFQTAMASLNSDTAASALQQLKDWVAANRIEGAQLIPIIDEMQRKLGLLGETADTFKQVNRALKTDYGNTEQPGTTTVNKVGGSDSAAAKEAEAQRKKAAAEAERAAAQAAAKAQRELNEARRQGLQDFNSYIASVEKSRTPLQAVTAELAKAREEFQKYGAMLTPEQYELAVQQIQGLSAEFQKLKLESDLSPMGKEIMKLGQEIAETFTTGVTDAFISFVEGTKSAKKAFKEFAISFLKEVAKMILQTAILYFIKQAAGMIGGAIGGPVGGAISSIGAGLGKSSALPAVGAFGAGLHTRDGAPQPMTTSIQPIGQQFNAGSLIPATGGGTARMRSEPQKVTINNYAGVEVKTRQMPDEMVIEIATKRAKAEMTSDLRRGGNPLANAMEGAYAVRRAGR